MIVITYLRENAARRRAIAAQPMQDRLVKPSHFRKLRRYMQRIAISRQPVKDRLIIAGGDFNGLVGRTVGNLMRLRRALSRSAKASIAARKNRRADRA